MNLAPALISLMACIVLAGACSPVQNRVEVDIGVAPNAVGVVVLCGREVALTKRGESLVAAVPITCEGSGEVRLRTQEGREVTCSIGYVTPGMNQTFSFALDDEACR